MAGEEVSFLIVFLITFGLTFVLRHMATSLDIVDKPAKRKVHTKPVALLGGLGIYMGFFTQTEAGAVGDFGD